MNEEETYAIDNDLKNVNTDRPSDLSKVTEILLNSKWSRRKTILKRSLISALATLDTISKIYDIQFLKTWIPYYCEYKTSEDGKGRQDIVDITKYRIDQEAKTQEKIFELMGRR